MLAGALKVGKVGQLFRVRSAAKSAFVVKVHWAPPFVSNQHLADMLACHCKVILYVKECCVSDGFQSCATGVRQIMCEGNKSTMPYTLDIVCPFTGETFEILLTIYGRKPICLRCRMEGHIRRDCNTQSCRHCNVFGHSSESCASKPTRGGRARSYANAAGRQGGPVERDSQTGEVGASAPGVSAPAPTCVAEVGIVVAAGFRTPLR